MMVGAEDKEKKQFLVSIVTPVINNVKHIEECLQSVLDQTYAHIEHIVVDGGSTDGTAEILSSYSAKHREKIRFIYSPDSKPGNGPGEAWNKGLMIASGDIFGWLGADDMLCGKDAIFKVVRFFLKNPDARFVHGGCNVINKNGELLSIHRARNFTLDELINKNNPIACPSAFYKQEVVKAVGFLDDYGNDLDYMIRIVKNFRVYCIDDVLSNFRVHDKSETGNLISYVKVLKKDYHIIRKHGGGVFADRARRYYLFVMLKSLGLLPLVSLYRNQKKKINA